MFLNKYALVRLMPRRKKMDLMKQVVIVITLVSLVFASVFVIVQCPTMSV